MTLTKPEIERYKRHLVLRGAGGLGSPLVAYLTAAGVGTIGIVDDDVVSLSNLQRQIIHDTAYVGMPKVDSAREAASRLNPHVAIVPHNVRLTADNALKLIAGYDVVADGSDNFATRYLASDACYFAKKTLVYGAVGPFDGYVTTFKPHLRDTADTPYPSYRCVFPEAPPPGTVANCAEIGVLGAVVGVIGTLMATEVLKELLGIGTSLAGRLMIWDALAAEFQELKIAWDPSNALSGTTPTIKDLSVHKGTAGHQGAAGAVCAA
jgi:molybdopterin-synthase adenylyltransferase